MNACVYVSVDVELCDITQSWWAIGACVINSQGTLLETFEIARVPPRMTPEQPLSGPFWRKHAKAKKYIKSLQVEEKEAVEEITQFYLGLCQRYPGFTLISDNVLLDVGTLDKILQENGVKASSLRPDGSYKQPICTWSYRIGMRRGERSVLPACPPGKVGPPKPPVGKWVYSADDVTLWQRTNSNIKHTPLADAVSTAHAYLGIVHQ